MVEMDALPDDCIAHIISLTTPPDAARFSAVSRAFRKASDSDAVWHKFLPPDLDHIVSTSSSSLRLRLRRRRRRTRKKDVFVRLCRAPILIDSGRKSFALDKWSGKKCYMIGSRGLSIVWGDNPDAWRWSSLNVSRFRKVAELLRACWLEVRAKMETKLLSADTYYAAYFIFQFVRRNCGFESQAVEVSVFSGSMRRRGTIYLDPDGSLRQQYETWPEGDRRIAREDNEKQIPWDREDGWKEVYLGEFFVSDPPTGEVQINLKEVKSGNRKSGLVVEGIELRPLHR